MTSPAFEAAAAQSSGGYSVDVWIDVTLEPMTKVWQGIGGHTNFFVSEEDAREARGAYCGSQPYRFAETLWRMAQVRPSIRHSYRLGIREYVVDLPVVAACGICRSNVTLGTGTVMQYYIPDWERYLFATGREHKFAARSYA